MRDACYWGALHVIGERDVHRIDIAAGQAISVSFVAVGLVYLVFRGKFLAFLLIAGKERY
jgi:hypothetical protein